MTRFEDILVENKLFEHDLVYRQKNILMPRPIRSKQVTRFQDLLDTTSDHVLLQQVWVRYKELGTFLSLEAIDVDDNGDEDEDEDEVNEYDFEDSFINDDDNLENNTKRRKLLLDIERKKQELEDLQKELELE